MTAQTPEAPSATLHFRDLALSDALLKVLAEVGYESPSPIQAATIPHLLGGRDVLGQAQTGTGKTAAFALPILSQIDLSQTKPQALVLAPTRELANQIEAALEPLAKATGLTSRTVFGGVGQNPQVTALRRGVDVVIACPGRLEDLIGQGHCRLDKIEITVLDEADHMADMGFLPGVRRILSATPADSQRLLFSATLDGQIDSLVKRFLNQPVTHEADSAQSPVAKMAHHVLHVEREQRLPVLVDLTSAPGRTVVFTRTKHGAKALARQLGRNGVPAVELHGNLSQNARNRNLDAFHAGDVSVLVATDIAARGIHVDDVALVVHADPPAEHKAYLHRSGRTARAGAEGTVVTLMTSDQVGDVRQLTRAAGIKPTTTRIEGSSHPVLTQLAPGERVKVHVEAPAVVVQAAPSGEARTGQAGRRRRGGRGRGPAGQGGQGGGQARQGSAPKASAPKASAPKSSAPKSSGQARTGTSRTGGAAAFSAGGAGRRRSGR